MSAIALALLAWGAALAGAQQGAPATSVDGLYAAHCAGCHGADRGGGRGPALTGVRLAGHGDDTLRGIILHGKPGTEMPAFAGTLADADIARLAAWLRTGAAGPEPASPAATLDPDHTFATERQRFRVHPVATGLDTPWGIAFLPDRRLLVTERSGRLRIVDPDRGLDPVAIEGLPAIHTGQDAGLLDVAVHPDYRRNGWIYLSYTDTGPPNASGKPTSMTVIVRGKLAGHRWRNGQELFRAAPRLYTASGSHYGSRFLFDRTGHLFFTLGERGDPANAQPLSTPLGKIHRITDDGRVPTGNPFVRTPGAVPTIWSYGHRNPEGLAWAPDGRLWEAEHGPSGGDEINVIRRGGDYGWGVVTMGTQPGLKQGDAPGMIAPAAWYTPSIAPSGIGFITSARYPGWRGSLLVTGLRGRQLRRLEVAGDRVVHQEVLLEGFARVRAVTTGPDGLIYLLLQEPTGTGTRYGLTDPSPGQVVRLEPVP